MITRPTTLILGAGASIPVGLVSGAQLTEEILATADGITESSLGLFLQRRFQAHEDEIRKFCEALRECSLPSIDRFLENRPEYASLGKACISFILSNRENVSTLFNREAANWYRILFGELTSEGASGGFDSFLENNLKIITFNYDRSLEQFLFSSLKAAYGKPDNIVARMLDSFPILHMYGQLGSLPWQVKEGETKFSRIYGKPNNKDWSAVYEASQGIRLISDRATEEGTYAQAREYIRNSERVHFIGFAYEKTNLERLGINWAADPNNNKYFGTGYGLGGVRREMLREVTCNKLSIYDHTASDYLIHDQRF